MIRNLLILLFSTCLPIFIFAQDNSEKKPPNILTINANYGFQVPGGDLADRFGVNSDIGFAIEFITKRLILGIESDFIFGGNVKEDVISNLRTPSGGIVSQGKELGEVDLSERGFFSGLTVGTIIPLSQKNTRSGIRISGTGGFMQHKIRIVDITESIRQLQGPYLKGYDRLTNGLAIKEFVGYQYFSNNRLLNFYFGVEGIQAFTQNRRSYNFDTMMKDETKRVDLLFGLRLGWTLPIFFDSGEEKYYY